MREVLLEYLLRGDDAKSDLFSQLIDEYYIQLQHTNSHIYDGLDPLLKK